VPQWLIVDAEAGVADALLDIELVFPVVSYEATRK